MKRKILMVAALSMFAVNLHADTPVMLSLVDPVQIPSRSSTVDGLEIGLLMGRCDNLNGIGVGTSVMVDGFLCSTECANGTRVWICRHLDGTVSLVLNKPEKGTSPKVVFTNNPKVFSRALFILF